MVRSTSGLPVCVRSRTATHKRIRNGGGRGGGGGKRREDRSRYSWFSRYVDNILRRVSAVRSSRCPPISSGNASNIRWFRLICVAPLCRSKENVLKTFVASRVRGFSLRSSTTIEEREVSGRYIYTLEILDGESRLFLYLRIRVNFYICKLHVLSCYNVCTDTNI